MTKIPMSLRIDPAVKAALEELARRQNRSLANLIETLGREACEAAGVKVKKEAG